MDVNNWAVQPSMDGSVHGFQSPDDNQFGYGPGIPSVVPSVPSVPSEAPVSSMPPDNSHNSVSNGKPAETSKPRPCDYCRRRKTRCLVLKDSSSCLHCQVKEIPCTFLEAPISRKKKLSFSNGSTSKKLKSDDRALGLRDITPVHDYSTIKGHSLLKRTLSLQYPRSSFYIGETSVFDNALFDLGRLDKWDQGQLAGDVWVRKVAPDIMFTLKNDYTEDHYEEMINYADQVERIVAPNGRPLINLYFRVIHPSFPILHKEVFLEKYSRTHREFSPPLLAAVYILALNWWHYDPNLSPLPKPDVEGLLKLAVETFSKVLEKPKLSAVQAGLLLVQCRPNHARNWAICSQVVALAEELGLGLDCSNWHLPKWERGLRTRLAWALFVQDKWLSLIEGRPSHIDVHKNWMVKNLTKEDFPETAADDNEEAGSADVENGRILFMEMVNLSRIVAKILDALFTISAVATIKDTEEILDVAKPMQIELRKWYQGLPDTVRMDTMTSKPKRLSSIGYLHLAYFAAEITLHRRIIKSLSPTSMAELIQVCRTAANTRLVAAVNFVADLKREQMQSFWHSSSCANFSLVGSFAALLHVTSHTTEEAEFYRNQLSEYLWILRVSSSGFGQMEAALQVLEVAISRIPEFGAKGETVEERSRGD